MSNQPSPINSADSIGLRLDDHYARKAAEAEIKFGTTAGAICAVAQHAIKELGQINATHREVLFLLDWIKEVDDILADRPPRIVLPR